jgi:hypothetical protein
MASEMLLHPEPASMAFAAMPASVLARASLQCHDVAHRERLDRDACLRCDASMASTLAPARQHGLRVAAPPPAPL